VSLTDDITDPRLAKALAHPLRLEILRHLGDRTASPSEIAAEIGAPLTNVSYHVRKLRALGLIKLVRKTPKRGVIEHYYSAKPRPTVTDEAWAETPDIVKVALAVPTTKRAAAGMVRAAAAGGFNRDTSHFMDQTRQLDERGWDDVAKLLHKFYDDLNKVEEESLARLDAKGGSEEAITAGFVIAFFDSLAGAHKSDGEAEAAPAAPARRKRAKAGA
jgi:DNA-binding transcriptional ArsR family regulator